ncbi:hypothetical protein [Streptomyces hundungensis]|uniref:hypothetical protein n=1 Tax=Streptomyces hundungensis TaxID=1077946 RepID=UPI0033D81A8E
MSGNARSCRPRRQQRGLAALPDLLGQASGTNWQRMIEVNVTGAWAVVDAFVPDLIAAAGDRGCADLVTISSVAAQIVLPTREI